MRGGGGVFAIATTTYIKAHPAFQAVNVIVGQVSTSSQEAYEEMITQFVQNDPIYMQNLTSGIWESDYPNLTFIFLKGFQEGDTVIPADYAAFDFLQNISGVTVELEAVQFSSWYSAYTELINPALSAGDLVGVSVLDISRIISSDLLGSESGRQNISNFITSLPSGQPFLFERSKPPALYQCISSFAFTNIILQSAVVLLVKLILMRYVICIPDLCTCTNDNVMKDCHKPCLAYSTCVRQHSYI